ncbi:MAG TPA: ankyrin repeat domain-containing protein [Terriglobia bacterium]|nr:ankyrin repeat domain-containing protein [Terriglobia bacterium]
MITDVRVLPPRPSLEQYKKQAKDLVKLWKSGDAEAVHRVRRFHPRFSRRPESESRSESQAPAILVLADAQLVLAREHGFESWPKFAKHIAALSRADSLVPAFELAADAIAAGDVAVLRRLLRENPGLIRERSTRAHRATLLHYVGANGVEDYRQKTPKNADEVLKVLLEAGAGVDAVADMYDGDTTLSLVATSVHPVRAGVQEALMERLLAAGAAVDPGGNGGIVRACLANGRGRAAEFLARRGARLNLESAAGVGRLDAVKTCFGSEGTLKGNSTRQQMQSGLNWACEYGHTRVVEFLLGNGADPKVADDHGQTPLHWAAIGGQREAARILLKGKAPLEVKNVYGGTVLDQAVWSALHDDLGVDYLPLIEALLDADADPSVVALPTGNKRIDEALQRRRRASR